MAFESTVTTNFVLDKEINTQTRKVDATFGTLKKITRKNVTQSPDGKDSDLRDG